MRILISCLIALVLAFSGSVAIAGDSCGTCGTCDSCKSAGETVKAAADTAGQGATAVAGGVAAGTGELVKDTAAVTGEVVKDAGKGLETAGEAVQAAPAAVTDQK